MNFQPLGFVQILQLHTGPSLIIRGIILVAGRVPTSPTGIANVLIHVLCASYMPRISLGGGDTAVNSILDEGLAVGSQSHETGA